MRRLNLVGYFLLIPSLAFSGQAASPHFAGISSSAIEQIVTMLPEKPAGYGMPCSDRAAWEPLAGQLQPEIKKANALLTQPFPAWSDDAYLDFTRTGSTDLGDKMMGARQSWIAPLVLAECAEDKGRFIPRIAMVLDQLSAQKSWTLPEHDPKLTSYNGTDYFVELNSAVLAHNLGEAIYLLGDKLPAATRTHVMRALEKRVFDPTRAYFASGDGVWWLNASSNWNAVCLDGVTGAALSVLPTRRERAAFVAAALHYSPHYLESYTKDGYGQEGIDYWNYGFSHYADLREELWAATDGKIDLFSNRKARKVALFGVEFQMLPGNYADFGDAEFMLDPNPPLVAYVANTFGLQTSGSNTSAGVPAPRAWFTLSEAVLQKFPNHSESHAEADEATLGLRTYYPVAGVLVSRPAPGGQLAVTIKMDGNLYHSHNDVGSFAIGLGDTQPVGDPGGPAYYTAQTFSKDRFQSRLLNSFGHPVPVVGGHWQKNAKTVHAKILKTDFTPKQDSITMDLTNAYDAPTLRRLERTMRHSRQGSGSIEIVDRFTLSGSTDIEESLPTHGTWRQVDTKTLEFTIDASEPAGETMKAQAEPPQTERLLVTISAPGGFKVTPDKIDDYGNPFTRLGVRIHLAKSGVVTMHFAPVKAD